MLWAGLLCASGEASQCGPAKASFRSDGQVCRSPTKLDLDKNSSSRDMFLGAMLYVATTKDQSAAGSALEYIKANDYKLCTDAVDNRCEISPTVNSPLWGTMGTVWSHIGLPKSQEMKDASNSDDTLIKFQSSFSEAGYPTHLVAVQLYLRQKVDSWSQQLQDAAIIVSNRQPNNPFYSFVAYGPNTRAAQLVLEKCPTEKPELTYQWAWQRDEEEQAWLKSKGWDCIFMVNVLVGAE